MDIIQFLEILAESTHHHIDLNKLLDSQPLLIKQLFLDNDSDGLKHFLNKNKIHTDRSTIFQL